MHYSSKVSWKYWGGSCPLLLLLSYAYGLNSPAEARWILLPVFIGSIPGNATLNFLYFRMYFTILHFNVHWRQTNRVAIFDHIVLWCRLFFLVSLFNRQIKNFVPKFLKSEHSLKNFAEQIQKNVCCRTE